MRYFFFSLLSRWAAGYDRYGRTWSKALLPGSKYPKQFYVLEVGDANGWALVREKLRGRLTQPEDAFVLNEIDVSRARDQGLRFVPNETSGTGVGHEVLGFAADAPVKIPLLTSRLDCDIDKLTETSPATPPEELTAKSLALQESRWASWAECAPRSFSVLPIRTACQASCPFCFSAASISSEPLGVSGAKTAHWHEGLKHWSQLAAAAGAQRAVITGGGEPMLLPLPNLIATVRELRSKFLSVLLITNGVHLAAQSPHFWQQMAASGLTTVALSRHGLSASQDAKLMGLPQVDTEAVSAAIATTALRLRKITVLQKGGVETPQHVIAAIRRAAAQGFTEICFKELYVASQEESLFAAKEANQYSLQNQVSLAVVLKAMQTHGGLLKSTLPWGAPVFDFEGVSVAAYTEPSVAWERIHRVARSWNYMANGQCFASLETALSLLPSSLGTRIIPILEH